MLTPGFEPLGFLQALALRAVSIAAGIVGDADPVAARAAIDVPSQGRRAAVNEVTQHGSLPSGDARVSPVGFPVRTEDVGDLEPRSHGWALHWAQPSTRPSGASSKSSGTLTRAIRRELMLV